MTDLERAVSLLDGHSLCLCRGEDTITRDERGIAPMMHLIEEGVDLGGYSAADLIVGRAAAMLFVRSGVIAVYGQVMSRGGAEYLESHKIAYSYGELTEHIINREGTDICPMEKAVAEIDDPDEGYTALCARLAELRKTKK